MKAIQFVLGNDASPATLAAYLTGGANGLRQTNGANGANGQLESSYGRRNGVGVGSDGSGSGDRCVTRKHPVKRSVLFDSTARRVKGEYKPVVGSAGYLKKPATQGANQGNTDAQGSREYNLAWPVAPKASRA